MRVHAVVLAVNLLVLVGRPVIACFLVALDGGGLVCLLLRYLILDRDVAKISWRAARIDKVSKFDGAGSVGGLFESGKVSGFLLACNFNEFDLSMLSKSLEMDNFHVETRKRPRSDCQSVLG